MKKKLSIGIFSEMMCETNGTAEAARHLAIGLGEAGHDVHVFAPSDGVSHHKGIAFHKTGGFRMSRDPEFYFSIPFTRYFACRHGYYCDLDIVHSITPMTVGGALALDVSKLNGIPKIITHHSPLQYYSGEYFPVIGKMFGFYAWKYERFIYNRFHVRHVPTLSKKQLILDKHIKEPIFALTNGILDVSFKRTKDAREKVMEEYHIPKDRKIMLYAGRQGPEKNVEAVIRAFRAVRDQGIDAHLILAGGGPYISSLKTYATDLGVADQLTQTGYVENKKLREIYDAADVSTLYNDIEAQGLVLLEAMAQGTPCIGKNSFGIKDVIVHGKTGYLANNETEFASYLARVLSDDELQVRLANGALEEVTEKHKMSKVIAVWEKVYNFMIDTVYPQQFYGDDGITELWREFVKTSPLLKM
jgi:glycosyltransferase involved in cell wall biosynthesis